jgi:hypothetical protein
VVEAFNRRPGLHRQEGAEFQPAAWFTTTALQPQGTTLGRPIVITWNIVPDGTSVDGFAGEAAAPSNLRQRLDAIYGSSAVWMPIFQGVFDRWQSLSGARFVFEPADDGAPLVYANGVAGVRADIRIAGHTIDGNFGILAYNFFPDEADMVIDTGDDFFADTAGLSIRLRNVIAHELGHALGMDHVCPIEQTKLLEPYYSAAFDGPRHDDARHAQYLYGDAQEPDDDAAHAFDAGSLSRPGSALLGPAAPPPGPNISTRSLATVYDQDFVRFTLDGPAIVAAVAAPAGLTYDDSPQSCPEGLGFCCQGHPTDSQRQVRLRVRVWSGDGTRMLATGDAPVIGASASVEELLLPGAGTYLVSISGAGGVGMAQMYTLALQARPACPADFNRDGFVNLDDLGDFITDFYLSPPTPGGLQVMAGQYPDQIVGFQAACPDAPDAPAPFDPDAYRRFGYRVGFSPDGLNACPLSPDAAFPNLDNLGDYITLYYAQGC